MHDPALIEHRVIAGRTDGPHLLVTGGIHGDEYEPVAAICRLIGAIDASTLRGRVTLVPVVNAPAMADNRRCGPDALDLARTFPGSADGSITQRIAHAAAAMIRDADFYIDLHTGGALLRVDPMTGYMLHTDAAVLEGQRRLARAFNLPVIWGTPASYEGRSLSVARDARVPAIYAEYAGGGGIAPAAVDAYVDGCLNVMGELGMIDREPPRSLVRHVVEDASPGAGHMQAAHPAPIHGLFTPALCCGQTIRAGDRIGVIVDALGEHEQAVTADGGGRVLVIRGASHVRAGDGLAVVLAVDTYEDARHE